MGIWEGMGGNGRAIMEYGSGMNGIGDIVAIRCQLSGVSYQLWSVFIHRRISYYRSSYFIHRRISY